MPSTRLQVRLTPRAGVDLVGPAGPDGALRIRVRAAPVDGAANEALLHVLADALDVPRTGLRIVTGAQARRKHVEVEGLTREEVQARLARRRGQ